MRNNWFYLSKKCLTFLILYYIIILISGIIISIYILINETFLLESSKSISSISLIAGISSALIGSSMFYLRKIYKASINLAMEQPTNKSENIREIGILTYYCLRPIFSIVFSILIYLTTISSIKFVVVNEITLTNEFIYLMMILSFFAGFASGDLITFIEEKSAEIAKKAIKKD